MLRKPVADPISRTENIRLSPLLLLLAASRSIRACSSRFPLAGGSVWALVKDEDVDGFIAKWQAAYSSAFPEPAKTSVFFPMVPGPGAFEVQGGMSNL